MVLLALLDKLWLRWYSKTKVKIVLSDQELLQLDSLPYVVISPKGWNTSCIRAYNFNGMIYTCLKARENSKLYNWENLGEWPI